MLLVPEEVMNLIYQKTDLETSPLVKSMSALNHQISNNLENAKLPADIKLKNHEQYFQRFMNLQDQRESFIPRVEVHSSPEVPTVLAQEPQSQMDQTQEAQPPRAQSLDHSDKEIVKSIPGRFRNQAEGLLQWIKKFPESITWNDKGEVSLEGKSMRGSSITDLVNDVVRSRKGYSPIARDDFTKVLAQLNTPEEFVRNEERRKLMSLFKAGLPPTPGFANTIPSPPTAPSKKRSGRRRSKVPSGTQRRLEWLPY